MTTARTVTVGKFACEALVGKATIDASAPKRVVRAIRCYLHDRDIHRPGWEFPDFMRNREPAETVELTLEIDDATWGALEEEAARQRVSAERLVEHAMHYYGAEIDAGRVTRRILDDLETAD